MKTDSIIKKSLRALFIICTGGMTYYNFEILFRGYSHFSMFLCGGLSFYTIGTLNEHPRKRLSFLSQMLIGTGIITIYEFITGMIVNKTFHLHVWDYSRLPFNIKGQICLPFSFLWFLLTPVCIVMDDIIRYALFRGE
ncbi:MAG: putative ABC transporter permease [Clostridiales bacterium]|nr:putative ABC transporter permease [Clostridiales bacterium]